MMKNGSMDSDDWTETSLIVLVVGTLSNLLFAGLDYITGFENLMTEVVIPAAFIQVFVMIAFGIMASHAMELKEERKKQNREEKISNLEERVEKLEDIEK